MTKNDAIDAAVEALHLEADDTYEGDELNDPDIQAWQQKKYDAAKVLKGLKDDD